MHDSGSTSSATFDLLRGDDVDFPTAADRAMLRSWVLSNRRANLRACLAGRRDAFGQPLGDDVHEEFQVQAVVPTWSKQGQFGFNLELTAYRSHAEGLLSCQVSSDQAPPSLIGLKVPIGLRALAQQLPGLALRGFSVLEAKGTASPVDLVFSEQARREREPERSLRPSRSAERNCGPRRVEPIVCTKGSIWCPPSVAPGSTIW